MKLRVDKTGKQRCKIPGVPSVHRGNWGWVLSCVSSSWRPGEECCLLWRITPYTFISPTKMTIFFGMVGSTNDNAWKPAKWAKSMLILMRWQISHNLQVRTTKIKHSKSWSIKIKNWVFEVNNLNLILRMSGLEIDIVFNVRVLF